MNTYFTYISLVVFLSSNIVSQALYKKSLANIDGIVAALTNLSNLSLLLIGFAFQVTGIISWLVILKNNSLIWAGVMTSLIPVSLILVGRFAFSEPLSKQTILGILIITIGLLIAHIPLQK